MAKVLVGVHEASPLKIEKIPDGSCSQEQLKITTFYIAKNAK